jgi:hypothetical protein
VSAFKSLSVRANLVEALFLLRRIGKGWAFDKLGT